MILSGRFLIISMMTPFCQITLPQKIIFDYMKLFIFNIIYCFNPFKHDLNNKNENYSFFVRNPYWLSIVGEYVRYIKNFFHLIMISIPLIGFEIPDFKSFSFKT